MSTTTKFKRYQTATHAANETPLGRIHARLIIHVCPYRGRRSRARRTSTARNENETKGEIGNWYVATFELERLLKLSELKWEQYPRYN